MTRLNSMIEHVKDFIDLGELLDQYKLLNHNSVRWNLNCILRIMDKLVDLGEHLNIQDDFGNTPLLYALQLKCRSDSIIRYIESGADVNCPNFSGCTPLHFALNFDHDKKTVFKILDSGAKIDVKDESGMTPLMCAITHKAQREVILRLLYTTPDINCVDRFGKTPLICALLQDEGDEDIIYRLIDRGADTTYTDPEGNTVLHRVCGSTWTCISTFIFNHGISINGRNQHGETPLFLAAKYRDLDKVQTLLALGCDPNIADNKKRTPLHVASRTNVIDLIIYYRGDIKAKDSLGFTPLDVQSTKAYWENFFCFIKHYLLLSEEIKLHKSAEEMQKSSFYDQHLEWFMKELDEMKKCYITKDFSFYKFCTLKMTSTGKFVNISRREYLYKYDEILEKFPHYFDIILLRMKKNEIEKKKYDLLQKFSGISIKTYSYFSCEFGEQLNYDCLENICRYLTHQELFNVFLASLEDY